MLIVKLLIGTHPVYKDLLQYPPTGIKYDSNVSLDEFEKFSVYSPNKRLIRKIITTVQNSIHIPRMTYVLNNKYDYIYSTRGILIINKIPWIVDFEHATHFVGLNQYGLDNNISKRIIEKMLLSKYCKRLIPHSNAAWITFKNVFKNKLLENKMEIIYPTIQPTKLIRKTNQDETTFIFNGRYKDKFGEYVLKTFIALTKEYKKINLLFISDTPLDIIQYYRKRICSKQNTIKFITMGPQISRQSLIDNYYMNSDILLYPSQAETYANILLLGMNAALPIICPDSYMFPEMVINEKNGFLIHSNISKVKLDFPRRKLDWNMILYLTNKNKDEFIKQMIQKSKILLNDKSLLNRIGKQNRILIESGKFAISERNNKLSRIFQKDT